MAWYHRMISRALALVPGLGRKWAARAVGSLEVELPERPWTDDGVDPFKAEVMLITTGGVHRPDQPPFDMSDSRGDTSYRWIPSGTDTYQITHDYYDHRDADRDINCLFPLPLARRLSESEMIGSLTDHHLSFMGHIEDPLVPELVNERLPELWTELEDRPDLMVLSPA